MADTFPLDPNSPVGQVRLLTSDVKQRKDPANPDAGVSYYFSDSSIEGFLAINGQNVKLAASDVLMAFATNATLVDKKIRTEDLQTDGPAETNALRLLAQDYRAAGNRAKEDLDALSAFDVVDFEDPVTSFDAYEFGAVGYQWH